MEDKQDIFQYISSEEIAYQQIPIEVFEGYSWNMFKHIQLSLLYSVSQYLDKSGGDRPFKNIIRPITNVAKRSEGFDVKDIILFVNSAKDYYKSFLIKKYHDKWARDNDIDTFIDDMVESYVDFGGALIKDIGNKKPEVVPLQRLAFCDQTDILSGPICEKHYYSPDQLEEMKTKGWKGIDDLILLSESYKKTQQSQVQSRTPTKYIEVYELHGVMPERWLKDDADENKYVRQMQVVSFYKKDEKEKSGITLFKGKEAKSIYKFIARDKIFGRALGYGGVEELFEHQVWTNYNTIRIRDLLDAASKVILQTTDPAVAKRQTIKNLENLQILNLAEGKKLEQVNTTPPSIVLFQNAIAEWELGARTTGSANDPQLGVEPKAGTPMGLQQIVVNQGKGIHDYRRGKLSTFLVEIYRDIIIPHIAKEITQGQEFLSTLDLDEMQEIADSIATNEANKVIIDKILGKVDAEGNVIRESEIPEKEEIEKYKQQVRDNFRKGGNKKFIKILKDELKDAPIDVEVSVAGKQKNLNEIAVGITNIFRFIFSNPQGFIQVMQMPGMSKAWNELLEFSGMSPIDFAGIEKFATPQPTGQPIRPTAPQPTNILA